MVLWLMHLLLTQLVQTEAPGFEENVPAQQLRHRPHPNDE